jgi:hypothetical protein
MYTYLVKNLPHKFCQQENNKLFYIQNLCNKSFIYHFIEEFVNLYITVFQMYSTYYYII